MATIIENTVAADAAQDNEQSLSEASQNNSRIESQPISEGSFSINTITNTPLTNNTDIDSPSGKMNEHADLFSKNQNTTDSKQSNDKENGPLDNKPKKMVKKKYRTFLDSDSEEEKEDVVSSLLNEEKSDSEKSSDSESRNKNNMKKSNGRATMVKRTARLIDSDSDDDNHANEEVKNNTSEEDNNKNNVITKKISALVDSDSEDNVAPKDSARSSPEERRKKLTTNRKKMKKAEEPPKKSKMSSLIDTDSDGDNEVNNFGNSPVEGQDNIKLSAKKNEKSAKKRTGSARASKEEAMRQIHSETQRLIRSSEVSLPYHRPKQRSLQDFLNRKQFIPALPEGLTTAAKVKMSSEIVGKVLEEKEKEAELFYKSSDSEDETISYTPTSLKPTEESSNLDTFTDQIAIEETQKMQKNDIQNAHNKKEIIKQGAVDLGMPRKLFANEATEFMEIDATDDGSMEDDENIDCEDGRSKTKETKQGLREASVPRKLFSNDYDEGVGSPAKNYDVSSLVTNKTTNSDPSEKIVVQSETIDEGIESLEQETEFPEQLENHISREDNHNGRSECINSVKEDAEASAISETPFISNKDIVKTKENDKTLKESDELDENLFDEYDPRNVLGHVFGLPPDPEDIEKSPKKLNIKNKLTSAASNICPKLRGAPGMMIDFSDEVKPNKDGVESLLARFYRHSAVTKPTEVNAQVTVLHTERTADGIQIVEQSLPYKLPTNDCFNNKDLNKPGAKHLRLKSELIEKMAKKRGEEWKLKEQQEKEEEEEECDSEDFEDESDNEADAKILEEENEISGESEPEEDDMPERKKKPKKKSEFVDEEAEVSGEEDVHNDDEDEDEDKKGNNSSEDDDNESDDNLPNADEEEEEESTENKHERKSRIIKAFEDDSNSLPDPPSQNQVEHRGKIFERTKTDVDMFGPEDNDDWLSDNELPPAQILAEDRPDGGSQLCKTPLTAVNVLRFVSPITQLTALNSAMDSPKDSSVTESQLSKLSAEKTLMHDEVLSCDSGKRIGFQKKLFQEPSGTVNDEELMDLCSGKFTSIESDDKIVLSAFSQGKLSSSTQVSQLLPSSSGSFFSQAIDSQKDEKNTKSGVDETSQDIRLTLDEDSQDLGGKEMEKDIEIESAISRRKFKVAASSEDEDDFQSEPTKKKKKILKKKKVKQLTLSDDEDAEEFSNEDEDEEEQHALLDDDTEDKYVDYDSEENEVVIVPKKDIKKVAANFLDAEAELSESEWGSADEDEKDMDKLELEEGDDEEIDEKQMRDQLGKMHVRQILDDDRRDVRMLQELLFDDGDLHTDGGGRERKFKWKNIDQLGEDGNIGPNTADVDENGEQLEEDNDLEWRKLRLEREKFIQEKMNTQTDEIQSELAQDSQIFKLGMKALSKKQSSQRIHIESEEPIPKKPVVPRTVMDLLGSPAGDKQSKILHKAVKRGSFLARGEESLARIAVQIKHTDTTIVTRKNQGNFVFAHISPSVASAANTKGQNVETESEKNPAAAKSKKRKPPAGITPRTAKKAKIEVTRTTGKKLF